MLRPTPLTDVRRFTFGPTSASAFFFEPSATMIVYGPGASFVTVLPSTRRSAFVGWTVPWMRKPLAMLSGISCFRFGALVITSYRRV